GKDQHARKICVRLARSMPSRPGLGPVDVGPKNITRSLKQKANPQGSDSHHPLSMCPVPVPGAAYSHSTSSWTSATVAGGKPVSDSEPATKSKTSWEMEGLCPTTIMVSMSSSAYCTSSRSVSEAAL